MTEDDRPPHDPASQVWILELSERIVSFLPRNDILCSAKLLNKAMARHVRDKYKGLAVLVRQPSNHLAFAGKWMEPGALRCLTFCQRLKLVALTAATGSLPNLVVAFEVAAVLMTAQIFEIAAEIGHLEMCQWLLQMGCQFGDALCAAARGGHKPLCEWLLGAGCSWSIDAAFAAAHGGHRDIMDWLVLQRPPTDTSFNLVNRLSLAAECCSLPELQTLHSELLQPLQQQQQPEGPRSYHQRQQQRYEERQQQQQLQAHPQHLSPTAKARILTSAACSHTPDWQVKVLWLEQLGFKSIVDDGKLVEVCTRAAAQPDAKFRINWLLRRYYPVSFAAPMAAIRAGNVATMDILMRCKTWDRRPQLGHDAAVAGHLDAVKRLSVNESRNFGEGFDRALRAAALQGHAQVVEWMMWNALQKHSLRQQEHDWQPQLAGLEREELRQLLLEDAEHLQLLPRQQLRRALQLLPTMRSRLPSWAEAAALLGDVGLLAVLVESGVELSTELFLAAVSGGCEEVLEWLAGRGCPMRTGLWPYTVAAEKGDLATVRVLRRLGCPFRPRPLSILRRCLRLPLVQLLLEDLCEGSALEDYWLVVSTVANRVKTADGTVEWLQGRVMQQVGPLDCRQSGGKQAEEGQTARQLGRRRQVEERQAAMQLGRRLQAEERQAQQQADEGQAEGQSWGGARPESVSAGLWRSGVFVAVVLGALWFGYYRRRRAS